MSRGLGRGLDAIIPTLALTEDDKVIDLNLNELRPNPYQPRKTFDVDAIKELAESIKQHGVIQPIIVRQVLKGFEIIAGERRFRASQFCGMTTIPAVVRNFNDQQVMEVALIENLQREDLNAIETAIAYQAIMDKFNLTQEELSLKVGKSRPHIANFLRLLSLQDEIKQHVSRGTLSMGHARAIAGIKDEQERLEIVQRAIDNQWSVRELESTIQDLQEKGVRPQSKPSNDNKNPNKDLYLDQVQEQLRDRFQTAVQIKKTRTKGSIEIEYVDHDDLQRIIDMLLIQSNDY